MKTISKSENSSSAVLLSQEKCQTVELAGPAGSGHVSTSCSSFVRKFESILRADSTEPNLDLLLPVHRDFLPAILQIPENNWSK